MRKLYQHNALLFFHQSVLGDDQIKDDFSSTIEEIQGVEFIPGELLINSHITDAYHKRFAQGDKAIVAYRDESPAHLSWLSLTQIAIDEVQYLWILPETHSCIYDCRTLPAFRGKGIYPEVLQWIVKELLPIHNRKHAWIYAEAGNKASIHGIKKAGFNDAGEAAARLVLGKAFFRTLNVNVREHDSD
jgi:RimJ/RimL family protein N-acetyltransferase